MVGKRMFKTAEKKLYEYQILLCQIEAYEQDKGITKKLDMNSFIKSKGRTSDPTGAAATPEITEPKNITAARGWVWAIEHALERHKQEDAEKGIDYGKAYLMKEYFLMDCLNTTKVRKAMSRAVDVMIQANIGERTFYDWKREVVQSVVYGAIQAGTLQAY